MWKSNWLVNLVQSIVFQTIISGVLVFILSQYILKFIIEPFQEYKKIIVKIDNKLKFYSNVIVNPPFSSQLSEDYLTAKKELRILSCELESSYKVLPFKKLRLDHNKIAQAVQDLIWLSNATGHRDETDTVNLPLEADKKIKEIRKNLKIPEI